MQVKTREVLSPVAVVEVALGVALPAEAAVAVVVGAAVAVGVAHAAAADPRAEVAVEVVRKSDIFSVMSMIELHVVGRTHFDNYNNRSKVYF